MWKAAIVEDYPVIRRRLRNIVEETGGFEIVCEADTGQSFLESFANLNADFLMLDVHLPDTDGLELAKKIRGQNQDIPILFITGFMEHAAESYTINAIDYILKPIQPERVRQGLKKVEQYLASRASGSNPHAAREPASSKTHGKLVVKGEDKLHFIDTETIVFLCKEGKKTIIFSIEKEPARAVAKRYYTNEALKDIMQQLNPDIFIRSHNSFIVNVNWIKEIVRFTSESYKISFKLTDEYALLNRDKLPSLIEMLKR